VGLFRLRCSAACCMCSSVVAVRGCLGCRATMDLWSCYWLPCAVRGCPGCLGCWCYPRLARVARPWSRLPGTFLGYSGIVWSYSGLFACLWLFDCSGGGCWDIQWANPFSVCKGCKKIGRFKTARNELNIGCWKIWNLAKF
jgi:hypothetical protein